jgi:hypothetical protein
VRISIGWTFERASTNTSERIRVDAVFGVIGVLSTRA